MNQLHINPYLFEIQFEAFLRFVFDKTGQELRSFAAHPFTQAGEGYKLEVYREAREKLAFLDWKESGIGSGEVAKSMIAAIEIGTNNLVQWQARYGKDSRPQQPLHLALASKQELGRFERVIFNLYRNSEDDQGFGSLVELFGKRYPLIAYCMFLKDRTKYLPIAPTYFESALGLLGAQFSTRYKCSWENYCEYLSLMKEVQGLLSQSLDADVSLLDAHSFAWILVRQMEGRTADLSGYERLSDTEREALVLARVGQGRFRQCLIDYWSSCAVTGCANVTLLRASHIKPWAGAEVKERLDLFNGLLLAPHLDAAFDSGFVSFDDDGRILISRRLLADDASRLGIHPEMKLRKIEERHKVYLAHHRSSIFAVE